VGGGEGTEALKVGIELLELNLRLRIRKKSLLHTLNKAEKGTQLRMHQRNKSNSFQGGIGKQETDSVNKNWREKKGELQKKNQAREDDSLGQSKNAHREKNHATGRVASLFGSWIQEKRGGDENLLDQ